MFTKRSREFPKKTSKTHLFRPIFINFRPNRDNVLFAAWTMQKPKEKPRISFSQNQVIICKNYLVIHGSKRWEKKQTSSLKVSGSSPKSDVLPLGRIPYFTAYTTSQNLQLPWRMWMFLGPEWIFRTHRPSSKIGFWIPGIFQHVLGISDICCIGSVFIKSCLLIDLEKIGKITSIKQQ